MIAHAPILSIVRMSRAQRLRCAIVPFELIAAAVSPTDTPIAVTMPGEHLHSSMIGISVNPPRRDLHRRARGAAGVPASSAAMRLSKPSAAIWSMPNVLYSLRRRSYGGRSPCSSSSRCGRISLSTNWRTASRTILRSSGHSNMAGSYGTEAFPLTFTRCARTDETGFSRVPRRSMHPQGMGPEGVGSWGGTGWIPVDISVQRTLPIDGALLADVLLRLRRDSPATVLRWTLGDRGAAEVDVCFASAGADWTTTARLWNETGLAVTPPRCASRARASDEVVRDARADRNRRRRPRPGDLARAVVDELAEELLWHATRAGLTPPWLIACADGSSSRRISGDRPKRAPAMMGVHFSGRPPRSPRGGRPETGAPAAEARS